MKIPKTRLESLRTAERFSDSVRFPTYVRCTIKRPNGASCRFHAPTLRYIQRAVMDRDRQDIVVQPPQLLEGVFGLEAGVGEVPGLGEAEDEIDKLFGP